MSDSTALPQPRLRRLGRLLKQAINGEEQHFTTGSIDRAIILLAIPMMLEMAMESLFALVDTFFVAKVGMEAVATVGFTESMLTLVYSIGIGLSSAATAMVSRRIGEGNPEAAARAGAQTILLVLGFSVVIAIPGFLFAGDLLLFMSDDPALVAKGQMFTRIMLTANLPILLLWMLNGIFRGAGDAATAMRALWIANGFNIVLDPIFIFGLGPAPELGVVGAAVATTLGRSAGVAYQLWQLFRVGRIVRVKWAHFRPDWRILRRLLELSAGSTGQFLIASASWIFMIYILGHIGTEVTAGYTMAIRIMMFTLLPCWGMANAASTLVGQNLGAGHPDRAEKSAWRAGIFNVCFTAFVGVGCLLFAPYLIGAFTQDPASRSAGTLALRILASGSICYGLGMVMAQSINGAGDTRTPTLLNFIFFWIVETPLAYALALMAGWGEAGVYWSIVIAETGLTLSAIWVFRKGRWKHVQV